MPRGPAPSWRARKEPLLDAEILASVAAGSAGGHEHGPGNGRFGELVYTGCQNKDQAQDIKRALFRAAKRQGVSLTLARIERRGRGYVVRFAAGCKTCGQQYVVSRYGPDRSAWPYNPRRRGAA